MLKVKYAGEQKVKAIRTIIQMNPQNVSNLTNLAFFDGRPRQRLGSDLGQDHKDESMQRGSGLLVHRDQVQVVSQGILMPGNCITITAATTIVMIIFEGLFLPRPLPVHALQL